MGDSSPTDEKGLKASINRVFLSKLIFSPTFTIGIWMYSPLLPVLEKKARINSGRSLQTSFNPIYLFLFLKQ
jgi:hypothetical protein